MKTKSLATFALCAIVLSSACIRQQGNTGETEQQDTLTAQSADAPSLQSISYSAQRNIGPTFKTQDGDKRPSCNVKLNLEFEQGTQTRTKEEIKRLFFSSSAQTLNEAVTQYGDSIVKHYVDEITMLYADTSYAPDFPFEYTFTAQGNTVADNADNVLCYKIDITAYEGGAHGSYYEQWYNFDRQDGKHITAAQAFDMSKENDIKQLIRQQLCAKYQCKDVQMLQDSLGILIMSDVFITDNNFHLCKDGVKFLFNPYDIAPWAAGLISVEIPRKHLQGLCKF